MPVTTCNPWGWRFVNYLNASPGGTTRANIRRGPRAASSSSTTHDDALFASSRVGPALTSYSGPISASLDSPEKTAFLPPRPRGASAVLQRLLGRRSVNARKRFNIHSGLKSSTSELTNSFPISRCEFKSLSDLRPREASVIRVTQACENWQ